MNQLLNLLLVAIALVAVVLSGPVIAYAFLNKRKKAARARRRSPVGIDLLRAPGHTLREQTTELSESAMAEVAMLIAGPLILLTVLLAAAYVTGVQRPVRDVVLFLVIDIAFTAWMVRRLWNIGNRMDTLHAGYDAEVAVGQALDKLMREGAAVYHDFPCDGFNIDHVVISTCGVYAVETKGYSKPPKGSGRGAVRVEYDGTMLKFPGWTSTGPIEQARRQAEWLSKWVTRATAISTRVHPILALPGWFIERNGRADVSVFSGGELPNLLHTPSSQSLSIEEVSRIAYQVEQRCRTVAPRLSEGGAK